MTTKSNHKSVIISFVAIISLAIVFIGLFFCNFKFTKRLPGLLMQENNITYLVVDKKIHQYLQQKNTIKNKSYLEFEQKTYSFLCIKIKEYNNQYIYETNLEINLERSNIAYFLVNNLSFFNFLN